MPTVREADPDVIGLLGGVLVKHHPDLAEAEVTIACLSSHATRDKNTGEPKGPALKLHGYPCWAVVKINSVEDRVQGKSDATIKVDGDRWNDLRYEEKVAVLDHECSHLVLVRDEDGQIKTDDAFRPKLAMRLHDLQIGGFDHIIERHKMDAIEAQQYRDLHRQMSQKTFPWG